MSEEKSAGAILQILPQDVKRLLGVLRSNIACCNHQETCDMLRRLVKQLEEVPRE